MHGLTHALMLDGRGGARPITTDAIAPWLETAPASPPEKVLWLHLDIREPEVQTWLYNTSGLDSLVVEALLSEETRPRATTLDDDAMLIILRGVNLAPGAAPEDMISIRIYMDDCRIISTRVRDLRSIQDILDQLNKNKGPTDAGELLTELTDRIVWHMSDPINDLEDRLAEIEDKILDTVDAELRQELGHLRRQVIVLRRYLPPLRDAYLRIAAEKVGWLDGDHKNHLKESTDRLIRHIEDLNAAKERATVAQEEITSRLTEQANARMYILSVAAGIFLPLSFLTGLFGINVGGIPGAEEPWAFLYFTLALVALVVAQVLFIRFNKWL